LGGGGGSRNMFILMLVAIGHIRYNMMGILEKIEIVL
jgi:hypothetical protein